VVQALANYFMQVKKELRRFSKRTGNWKLVSLTTWGWRRVCFVAYMVTVSKTHHPSNRKVSCQSS